jgi:sugar phosphate isomerase/epimerase
MALNVHLGVTDRPWGDEYTLDDALAGIATAGFQYYGFLRKTRRVWGEPETTPEQLAALKAQVQRHGLTPSFIPSSVSMDLSEDDAVARVRRIVDHAKGVGVDVLVEMGAKVENAEKYFAVMRRAAPYAESQGVTIALKPHGGLSTTGDDCLRAVQAVNHPAFQLCFDPGNLLHYAGQRPEQELPKLAPYSVAMCVKDETGGLKGNVNVTPGDGDVDFLAVFKILKDHGFEGKPAIIECLGGKTKEEVDWQATRAFAYLSQVLVSV